jgi:hypothetical protein
MQQGVKVSPNLVVSFRAKSRNPGAPWAAAGYRKGDDLVHGWLVDGLGAGVRPVHSPPARRFFGCGLTPKGRDSVR